MDTDRVVGALWVTLHELRDTLRMLALTVEEDHPRTRAVPEPVERAVGDVADLLGDVNEAIAAAAPALSGPAGRTLDRCQARLIDLGRRLDDGLGAPERLDDLATVARERGGGWPAWRAGVTDGVGRVRHCLWEALSLLSERPASDPVRGEPADCSARRTDGVEQ